MRNGNLSLVIGCALLVAACAKPPQIAGVPDDIDYNWHVRPILSENCFQCHGPDEEGLKAGLRLDVEALAHAELPESPGRYAIRPGNPGDSEIVRRTTSDDPDVVMPPPSTRKSLTAAQKEILRRWIDDGAEYRPHWAFIEPQRPTLPDAEFADRNGNPIDRFIDRDIVRAGLEPSREADRESLINRVYLTLTGLPPTLEAVDAFLAARIGEEGVDPYEKVVDELLASDRYAEHMASYWLDLARWSDTDGFLDDHHDRFLYPWRDWVIDAFDRNMPFDEFGTWQLAGDLLPDPTREQILATAFLRVGKRSTENGAIDEEYKAEYMIERTDNALGTALMGLTLGCARCHDHRYDPISQQDYYQLGAFFNSNDETGHYSPGFSGIQGGPTLPWPTEAQQQEIASAAGRVNELEVGLRAMLESARSDAVSAADALLDQGADSVIEAVRDSLRRGLAAHYPLEGAAPAELSDLPERVRRLPPPTLTSLATGSTPPVPENESEGQRRVRERRELESRVTRAYAAELLQISPSATPGIGPAVIQSPVFGAGIAGNALWFDETNKGYLDRGIGYYDRSDPFSIDLWFYAAETYDDVLIVHHMAENNSGRTGYKLSIVDGRLWVQLAHAPPANMIALESADPFPVGAWTHVTLTYDGTSRAAGTRVYLNGAVADMRVDHDSLSRSMLPFTAADVFDPFVGLAFGTRFRVKAPVGAGLDELRVYDRELAPIEVAQLHAEVSGEQITVQRDALSAMLAANDERVIALLDELTAARTVHDELVTGVPQVLVMGESPQPVPTHVLGRGVYDSPLEEVEPRGLATVMAWDDSLPPNRLGLARWLFDLANPLTARVFVNRIWQMHFGRGLVETSEDFGSQGSIPTHPELLDWLTEEFVESGWDVKALHRLIVSSATYRQTSDVSEALAESDPQNMLYARAPRWRMTAEMVRDQALAVSGLLDDEVGGESATPYQPDGIWNPLITFYRYPEADSVPADEHHRRTMYTFVKRNALHPGLKIFDFMNRTESVARRRTSNTPLQALALMNDPQFVEAYRALATRLIRSVDDPGERLTRLYRIVTRSTPDEATLDLINAFYADQLTVYSEDESKARALINTGITQPDPTVDPMTLAALTNVAALVMNSPEAWTVR